MARPFLKCFFSLGDGTSLCKTRNTLKWPFFFLAHRGELLSGGTNCRSDVMCWSKVGSKCWLLWPCSGIWGWWVESAAFLALTCCLRDTFAADRVLDFCVISCWLSSSIREISSLMILKRRFGFAPAVAMWQNFQWFPSKVLYSSLIVPSSDKRWNGLRFYFLTS